MSSTLEISVQLRDKVGTSAARELRRNGSIPCVLYGSDCKVDHISMLTKLAQKVMLMGNVLTKLFLIKMPDGKIVKAIMKQLVRHPITGVPRHIDFMSVKSGNKINIRVPMRFINQDKSEALKMGGVLNIIVHHLDISCDVDNIPDYIDIDVAGYKFHDAVYTNNIKLPDGATINMHDKADYLLASVVAPSGVVSAQNKE